MTIPILAPNLIGQAAQQRHDVFNADRQNAENRAAAKRAFTDKLVGTFVDAGLQAAQNFGMAAYKESTEGERDAQRVAMEKTKTDETVASNRAASNVDQIGYKAPAPVAVDESPFKPEMVKSAIPAEAVDPLLPKMNVVPAQKPPVAPGPRYELPQSAPVQGRPLERYGTTVAPKPPVSPSPAEVLAAVPEQSRFAEMAQARAVSANKQQGLDSVAQQAKALPVYAQEWQRATIDKRESDAVAAAAVAAQQQFTNAKTLAEQNQKTMDAIIKARDANAADLYKGGQIKHAPDVTAARQPTMDTFGFARMQPEDQRVRSGGGSGGGAKAPAMPPTDQTSYIMRSGKQGMNATITTGFAPVGDWLEKVADPKTADAYGANPSDTARAKQLVEIMKTNAPDSDTFKAAMVEGAARAKSIQDAIAPDVSGTKRSLSQAPVDVNKENKRLVKEAQAKTMAAVKADAAIKGSRGLAESAAGKAFDSQIAAINKGKGQLEASFAADPATRAAMRAKALSIATMAPAQRDAAVQAVTGGNERSAVMAAIRAHDESNFRNAGKIASAELTLKQQGPNDAFFVPTQPAPNQPGPRTLEELIANTTMTSEQKQQYGYDRKWLSINGKMKGE